MSDNDEQVPPPPPPPAPEPPPEPFYPTMDLIEKGGRPDDLETR